MASNEIEIGIPSSSDTRSRSQGVDGLIGDWAETHFGVVTRRRLLAFGLTDDDIHGRIRRGTLRPATAGVFFVGHRSGVYGQREALALAAAGPGAALSGPSAAAWLGITERWKGPVHIIAPRARAVRSREVVRHCDTLERNEVIDVRGMPCVIPERAVMDLPRDRLRQGLQWLMTADVEIKPIVARMQGRRGARAFRAEVAQLMPHLAHSMSELETRFLRLCQDHGLPMPVVNGTLASGDLIDCAWPEHRLVVELDGRRWHQHRDREDRERDHRRVMEGRVTFRFAWPDVTRTPDQTADKLRRGLDVWPVASAAAS